eukprot:13470419-Ditylum_brightwellii.AAC.1
MKKRKVLPSPKDMEVDEPEKKEVILDNQPTNEKTNNHTIDLTETESAGKADEPDNERVNLDDDVVEVVEDSGSPSEDAGKAAARVFFEKNVNTTANAILLQ